MEPMELDHDESQEWIAREHQSSLSSELSDMDIDASPSKYDHTDHLDGLRQTASGDCHFPPVIDSVKQKSGHTVVTPVRPSKKLAKTGYGIPEDDPTFCHFPEKGLARPSTDLVRRRPASSSKDSRREENIQKSPSSSTNTHGQKRSCLRTCCSLVFRVVICLTAGFLIFSAATFYLNLQQQKCRMSRYFNTQALKTDLETFVFGQHLASKIIPEKIDHYFKRLSATEFDPADVCKPLVLSFHGWTGVGKNYVSRIISETFLYSTVNQILIPLHFPHEALEHKYGQSIEEWLVTNNTECSVNLAVIDEMDKSFSPVIEGIVASIEHLSQPCHIANPTIFLLLSNSYATDINRSFFQFIAKSPSERESIPSSLFQPLFLSKPEDHWDVLLAEKNLIDAYVPFLPLERRHVEQCVKRELVARRLSTVNETVESILEELTFTSVSGLEISTTGCKRVADKVDYVTMNQEY